MGLMMPPHHVMSMSESLEYMDVTLRTKDVIKFRHLRGEVHMGHLGGPTASRGFLVRKRPRQVWVRPTHRRFWKDRVEGVMQPQAKGCCLHRTLEEAENKFFHCSSRVSVAPPTPWTSDLQNSEIMNLFFVSLRMCECFLHIYIYFFKKPFILNWSMEN